MTARGDIPSVVKPISMGLGGYSYYSSGPFSNTMLTGGGWLEFDTNWGDSVPLYNTDGTPNPQMNAKGLPNYLNPGKKLRMLLWPYSVNKTGQPVRGNTGVGKWVITWEGDADIRLNGSDVSFITSESSGSSTGSLVNGRRVYNMGAGNPSGHITVEAINSPVTDLKVWLPDPVDPQNQSLENASSMWHPTFIDYLDEIDLNHLRFMDWGHTNASPLQDWADRRLPNQAYQRGVLNRRSPAEGIILYTTGSGQDIYVKGDRDSGISYEYMVDLCNTTGRDMWICVPHLATDNFIDQLANLILYGSDGVNPYTSPQANPVYPPLDPSLKVYLEYSNEIWSNGASFPQGNWAQAQADSLGISKAQFNARRFCDVWSRFQTVFGGSSRIVRCAAVWTARDEYTTSFLQEIATYGPTLSPAVTADIISPTTYFGNGIQDWANEQANLTRGTADQWFHTDQEIGSGDTRPVSVPLADSYWSSPELAAQLDATFAEWKKRIFSGSTAAGGGPDATGGGGGFSTSLHDDIFSVFGQHLPILAYEGGPSLYTDYLDRGGVEDDGVTNFTMILNRQPEFAEIYEIQLNMARAKGLSSHSMFVDVGLWGKFGQWGHLEYPDQPVTESVKWQAVSDWATDMVDIRPIDDVLGSQPTFITGGTLPMGNYLSPYSQDVVVTGGDVASGSSLEFKVIGSLLPAGMTATPHPTDSTRYRISGTPGTGGWGYLYIRVNDDDGDASWQIFSFYISGGPGTLVEVDLRGTFSGTSSLPWTQTHVIDSAITWSGLDIGAAYSSGGGTATGSDGTGVSIQSDTDGIRFGMSQGDQTRDDSTLVSAIADDEYMTFTITPQVGQPLDLSKAEFLLSWMREQYHAPRNFVVMTSIDGFTVGDEIYASSSTPGAGSVTDSIFTLPNSSAYQNLTTPVEFRIYFFGSQYGHRARILGLKLTQDEGAIITVQAPAITTDPVSQTVTEGDNLTFTVVATNGGGVLNYQWKRGSTNIGTNAATLVLNNVQSTDTGSYSVVVTNSAGSVTSNTATLTVEPATQPPGDNFYTAVESDFTGTNPSSSLPWTGTTTLDSAISYSGWTKGAGIYVEPGDDALTFSQGFPGEEINSTLALAIADSEYWSTTISPTNGTLNLRSAEIELKLLRISYHSARRYAVFTSIGGFSAGQEIFDTGRFTSTSEQSFTFQLPQTTAYEGLSGPTEIRIVPYAGQYLGHDSSITGFKLSLLDSELWTSQDIGSVGVAGSSSYDNATGTFTINGSGTDIWGSSDQFHYTTLNDGLTGDGSIIARVTSQTNTNGWAKAGVMIRDDLTANAKTAYVVSTPNNGVSFQYRTATWANTASTTVSGTAPKWLKLTRTGDSFSAYHSEDGQAWTQIGTAQTITMGSTVDVGLCVTSHNNTALSTVEMDNVSILTGESWTSQDIGSPALAGSSTYDNTTGAFTINGSGADIWGSSDQFHFVTSDTGVDGDADIIARVTSQTNTNNWAKAGVMIRDGLAANAKTAYVVFTPSNRVSFQYRTATGVSSASTTEIGIASEWVRLTRTGDSFTAFHSEDGQAWTQIGTAKTITMGNDIQIGLCVSSHENTALSTAVMDNVVITP